MEIMAAVRRFKSNSKRRANFRISPSIVPAASDNRESTDFSEMSKAKRIKFTHPEARTSRSDVPKTSEYAFFKKLKEDMGGNSRRPLHKDTNLSKNANANHPNTETAIPSNRFKHTGRKLRSPLQAEKEMPVYQFSLPSSPIQAEFDNAWGQNSKGDEYVGKGILAVKRQKLCQLVANSCPEVGEGSSKGLNLVSALVSRLFPKCHEKKCCQYSNSEERVMDTAYQLAALPEPYTAGKISTIRHTCKFNYGSCCNDDFPEAWFGIPRKIVFSNWDVTNSHSRLVEYDAAINFQNEETSSVCGLDGEAIKKNFTETDSSCYLCFHNYQPTCSGPLKQRSRFLDPNEPASREPRTLLLGWDVKEEKEQNFSCAWDTEIDAAYQQTLDDSRNAITVHTPSLPSNYSLDFHSLPHFLSVGGHSSHDLGRNYKGNYAVLEANHFRSFTPRYLPVAEDCDNCLEKNNGILHCQDDPCCTGKCSGRKGNLDTLPSSRGITDDLGWTILPMGESASEDYSWNSRIFHLPSNSIKDGNPFTLMQDEESSLYCPKIRETTLASSEGPF